jgi:hypothetical protein
MARERVKRWSATFAVATLLLGGNAAVPAAAVDETPPVAIGCDQASNRVQVTVSAVLDPSCTYTAGLDVTASDVTLDCRGALIQKAGGGIGILVQTPADVDMANVTIRNCRVDGFVNSVHLRRQGFNSLPAGHEYDHHLDGVTILDSILTGSRGVGLYVDGYVTNTTIRHVVILGAGSDGIYLDAGSRYGRVVENVVVWNGYRENGPNPEGTVTEFGGVTFRFWGPGREGIAVDGSRDNRIASNWIAGNSAGGVFLYTNCGEYVHSDPANWVEHRFGAEDNTITGNLIVGGRTGVWVGSRMAENVYPMDCSDVPYVSGPIQAITLDRAPHTTIRSNVITDVDYGVRVEDDGTRVVSNLIGGADASRHAVIVGTPFRTSVLAHPVTSTIVRDNVSTIVGNASPYRWVDGVSALDARRNTALGVASAFCPAPDVPRGPFVMVDAVAIQDPNGPPVPKPDFEIPRLGALAPC